MDTCGLKSADLTVQKDIFCTLSKQRRTAEFRNEAPRSWKVVAVAAPRGKGMCLQEELCFFSSPSATSASYSHISSRQLWWQKRSTRFHFQSCFLSVRLAVSLPSSSLLPKDLGIIFFCCRLLWLLPSLIPGPGEGRYRSHSSFPFCLQVSERTVGEPRPLASSFRGWWGKGGSGCGFATSAEQHSISLLGTDNETWQ